MRKFGKMEVNWVVVVDEGIGIMISFIFFECCIFVIDFEVVFCDVFVLYFCFRFMIE